MNVKMDYLSLKWSLVRWAIEREPMTIEHLQKVRASYLRSIESLEKKADKAELREMMLWFASKEEEIEEKLKALRTILEANKDSLKGLKDILITDDILLSKGRQIKFYRTLKEECKKRLQKSKSGE